MPTAQSKDFIHPHAMVLTYLKPKKDKIGSTTASVTQKQVSQVQGSSSLVEGNHKRAGAASSIEGNHKRAGDAEDTEKETEEISTVLCTPKSDVSKREEERAGGMQGGREGEEWCGDGAVRGGEGGREGGREAFK
jgi:hypothetical protein